MQTPVVYYNAVEQLLEKGGYRIGLEVISDDITRTYVATYWYLEEQVFLVQHNNGILHGITNCNTGKKCSLYDKGIRDTLKWVANEMVNQPSTPPSILHTFTGVLFKEYDSNIEKYDRLMQARDKFASEFLSLFQNEIDHMTSGETSATTSIARNSWYTDDQNKLFYVADVVDSTVLLRSLTDIASNEQILDLRELSNNYVQIEVPSEMHTMLQTVLNSLHSLFNVSELVPILCALGYENLEVLDSIKQPVIFATDSNSIHARERHISKDIIFKGTRFDTVLCCDSSFVSLHFTEPASIEVNCAIQSPLELMCPCGFYDITVGILSNILTTFQPIMQEEQVLQGYLYQLLLAMESIRQINEISYDATWDDFPIDGKLIPSQVKTSKHRLLKMIF